MRESRLLIWIIMGAAIAGCGQSEPEAQPPEAAVAPTTIQVDAGTAIANALTSTERFPGDADEDARRHPQEVLEFLGVEPGMRVLDFLAGGGYYTELLSRVVGADGTVIAYNNALYQKFFGERLGQRLDGGRLANVRQLNAEPNDVMLEPGELDAALFVMSYHDLYHKPAEGNPATDIPALVARLYQAMQPGGIVIVQDHVAAAGGDTIEVADSLHRIDPEAVKRDFTGAGFTFDGESQILRNPEDDHSKGVFDESIRGRTDRFMVRFRKPPPSDTPRTE